MTAETNAAGAAALASLFGVDQSRSDDVASEVAENTAHAASVDALFDDPESAPVDPITDAQRAIEKADQTGDPEDIAFARALVQIAVRDGNTGPKPNPTQGSNSAAPQAPQTLAGALDDQFGPMLLSGNAEGNGFSKIE